MTDDLRLDRTNGSELQLLGDGAYERLRALIVDGSIPPGTLIRDADLGRQLRMSRTPVREALRRLAGEKLLQRAPQRGYVVAQLSENELENLYNVRALLEGYAARLACKNRSNASLGEMTDILDEIERAIDLGDDRAVWDLNGKFHDVIARASGNQHLVEVLDGLRDRYQRYRPRALSAHLDAAHSDHRRMLQAIAGRDADLTAQIAAEHIMSGLKVLREPPRSRGPDDAAE